VKSIGAVVGLSTLAGVAAFTHHREAPFAPRVAIVIVDGLRPDLITPHYAPNMAGLRIRGASFTNAHSSFPTVTRVNGTVMTTGMFPGHTGIVGNTLYDPAVDSTAAISTGDDAALEKIAAHYGRLVPMETLGERLTAKGLRYVVVTSGSTGGSLVVNPQAPKGVGITINPGLGKGTRVSFTDSVSRAILAKFGSPPTANAMAKEGMGTNGPLVAWADRVLRGYVLPVLKPDVLLYWITEPDHAQHEHGPGSPQGLAGVAAADSAVGNLLAVLDSAGGKTNLILLSDHGFISHSEGVPLSAMLVSAGLKHDRASNDVFVVGDEHIAHIFVKGHDAAKSRAIAKYLEEQPSTAAVFARDSTIPGTFSLTSVHLDNPTRGADLVAVLTWTSKPNAFGLPGEQMSVSNGASTDIRPITNGSAGHGGLSPFAVHSTMILSGPAFQRTTHIDTPTGNVDVMPTVLKLLGMDKAGYDGRVLREAFATTPEGEWPKSTTKVLTAKSGAFESSLQLTTLGTETYIDAAWRGKTKP
jgi:arylsulfatase A-like enzyme